MLFAYKAKLKTGEIAEGIIEAADRFALSRDLRSRGSTPISIIEKKSRSIKSVPLFDRLFSRVSVPELIIMTKNLSGMLRAGLSLYRSLSVLEKQTKNSTLHKILVSLEADINMGATLSSGLSKFPNVFSPLFVSMVKAGEESGNLSNTLTDIGLNMEKSHALTRKVRGALIYPGVILSAMVVIGILMFAIVVPTLANTFRELGITLPLSTRILIAIGNFLSNNLILSFALLISGVLLMFALFRAKFMEKYIDYIVVRLPIVGGLAKELNTARTTRTLSSLLLSGVGITRAIDITKDVVQNIYYKKVLEEARAAVERGVSFGAIFENHSDLYPVMMAEMIEVGEETGKLSDMLLQVAVFYEEEIENKTKNLSTIIEPVLMVVIGGGVGFFAISMISPLYSILGSIE